MTFVDQIAEARIREAMASGQLDDLPGQGKPLNLDDDSGVPEEFRLAYRILKNSGLVPPEIELRGRIDVLEETLLSINDIIDRNEALKKLHCLYARLENFHGRQMNLALREEYYRKVMQRLSTKS